MRKTIRVRVETETEAYPVLSIYEIGESDGGFEIPDELLDVLTSADQAVRDAEKKIMKYIARKYPDAIDVIDWVKDCDE